MEPLGWRTIVAATLLVVVLGLIFFRWNENDRRERLGGVLLLTGAAIGVFEEQLFVLTGVGDGALAADAVWLVSTLLVLSGVGLVLASSVRDR